MLLGTDGNLSWAMVICTAMFVIGLVGMEFIEGQAKIEVRKIDLEITILETEFKTKEAEWIYNDGCE